MVLILRRGSEIRVKMRGKGVPSIVVIRRGRSSTASASALIVKWGPAVGATSGPDLALQNLSVCIGENPIREFNTSK
jgi:hypothetical protein